MAKYIDADLLKKEIERKKKVNLDDFKKGRITTEALAARDSQLIGLSLFINSIQQEQQEVGLEKDVESWFFNDISFKINVEHTMYYYFQECAHRYYELGLKAK